MTNDQESELNLEQFLQSQIQSQFALTVGPLAEIMTIRHAVTRYRIQLRCFETSLIGSSRAKGAASLATPASGNTQWVTYEELQSLPLSSSGRKIASKLAYNLFLPPPRFGDSGQ